MNLLMKYMKTKSFNSNKINAEYVYLLFSIRIHKVLGI